MDNIAAMKVGADLDETHKGLEELMAREGGVLEWAKKHNCSFGVDKFKLVDFTQKREKRKEKRGNTDSFGYSRYRRMHNDDTRKEDKRGNKDSFSKGAGSQGRRNGGEARK